MEESTQKNVRRTPQLLAEAIEVKFAAQQREISGSEEKRAKSHADFDAKVAAIEAKIKALNEKKKTILSPKPRRKTKKEKMRDIINAAAKNGMSPEEIAEKLGINQAE